MDIAIKGSMTAKFLATYSQSAGINTLAISHCGIITKPKMPMTAAFVNTMPDETFMTSFSPREAINTKKLTIHNPYHTWSDNRSFVTSNVTRNEALSFVIAVEYRKSSIAVRRKYGTGTSHRTAAQRAQI